MMLLTCGSATSAEKYRLPWKCESSGPQGFAGCLLNGGEMNPYTPILLMIVVALVVAVGGLVGTGLLGPKRYNRVKLSNYECGSRSNPERRHRPDVPHQVLPDRDDVHHLRHRSGVPLPLGGLVRETRSFRAHCSSDIHFPDHRALRLRVAPRWPGVGLRR